MIDPKMIIAEAGEKSTKEIAEKYGISQRRVQQILKENGIKCTIRSEHITKESVLNVGYVYKITIGNCVYIGQTADLNQRMRVHKSDLKSGKHACALVQRLYDLSPKQVASSFDHPEILKKFSDATKERLLEEEKRSIIEEAVKCDKCVVNGILGDIALATLNRGGGKDNETYNN